MALQDFVAKIHSAGQRWVPILDSPIHIRPGHAPYDSGIAQDVFMKDFTGRPYVGQVISHLSSYHVAGALLSKLLPSHVAGSLA